MAKKLTSPAEFLTFQGITLDKYGTGTFMGRNTRLLEIGIFQIGDDDFDRWANSVDLSFDLSQAKGQRQFARWLKDSWGMNK